MGCGAYFQGSWFFLPWPAGWENTEILKDICFLKMIPVVLAIEVWGLQLRNKKVVFHVDNIALVSVINKQTTKSKRLMELVRHFVLGLIKKMLFLKLNIFQVLITKEQILFLARSGRGSRNWCPLQSRSQKN